ncbi:snRNA-activating protein complex subunit 4-like [Xenia sp. Carnegie-2017]|uniref:snRNA-activating protein complex subunit 4-like n=1 Tax=Xenia sp. Carnegie-2017 TaxID=2897299 RepID=UPI001F036838|nr:snRNA-activating protein complex subunit 4-like [Xenia sp. Carnegie-2017]
MVDNPLNTSQTELTDHGSLQLENNTDGKTENYCLTELQPATNESLQNIIPTSVDENLKSYSTMCTDPEALSNDNEEVLLSDEDEQSIDQKQCLKLNRQYQAVIKAQLRKIERLITENKEKQLGLTQTSPAMAKNAENLDFKGLQSFLPYFKSHGNKGPEDNEDTVLRKSIDQPSPFELPPRPWSIEEEKTLSDAVKSDVLQSKIKPLLQKVEALTPKPRKMPEEEKELEELNMAIDRLNKQRNSVCARFDVGGCCVLYHEVLFTWKISRLHVFEKTKASV